jgi:hypothetical protein
MLLFFKQIYRDPILRGEKRDTVRTSKRIPKVGAVMQACVGPSRIFARLLIESVQPVGALPAERRAQVEQCYGTLDSSMVMLVFRVLDDPAHPSANRPA